MKSQVVCLDSIFSEKQSILRNSNERAKEL